MTGPDPHTVMIQPVKNGWVVLHWPPEPVPLDDDDDDDDTSYDPSAEFVRERRERMMPDCMVVGHVNLKEDTPEPDRYVFQHDSFDEMMKFVRKRVKDSTQEND